MNLDWGRKCVVALGIVLLLLPAILGWLAGNPLLRGSEGYAHLRIAEHIANNGIPGLDPSMPERRYVPNILDLVLAVFVRLFGSTLAYLLLPFLLGVGTVWLVQRAMQEWKLSLLNRLGFLLVFVLSPFFVNAFVQPSINSVVMFLLAAYFSLLTSRTGRSLACLLVVSALLSTTGLVPAIVGVVLPFLARSVSLRVSRRSYWAAFAAFVLMVSFSLPAYLQSESAGFAKPVPIVGAVSDFGSAQGLSLFAWLLGFIGLVLIWKSKKRFYSAIIATVVVLVVSWFAPSALVFAHFAVSFLAGVALAFLAISKWSFENIRWATLLVLVCGLLFSTLAHSIDLAQGQPTGSFMEGILTARSVLPENTVVLAHPKDGFWVAYWAQKPVFLDLWSSRIPGVNERWAVAQSIWHSQDIARLKPVLVQNRIGGLVITREMREGLVWDLPEQDLLFLLRNNETFKNVYSSDSVEVWTVLPQS